MVVTVLGDPVEGSGDSLARLEVLHRELGLLQIAAVRSWCD